MCNLYRLRSSVQEIVATFRTAEAGGLNFAEEIYPGYSGLVVEQGCLRSMAWGFPRPMTGRQGQPLKPKAVTNARADKLATWFWRDSFARRRCLIPVSAWAEPQGEERRMTRTWYGLPDQELFAVGGLWRHSVEWGAVYAMVMVDSSPQMAAVHDRMPVILRRDDWPRWTEAAPAAAFALCRTWPGPLTVDATAVPWAAPRQPPAAGTLFG